DDFRAHFRCLIEIEASRHQQSMRGGNSIAARASLVPISPRVFGSSPATRGRGTMRSMVEGVRASACLGTEDSRYRMGPLGLPPPARFARHLPRIAGEEPHAAALSPRLGRAPVSSGVHCVEELGVVLRFLELVDQ